MTTNESDEIIQKPQKGIRISTMLSWVCASVILFCLFACIFIAIQKSEGLSQVRVTAMEGTVEPKDHDLPFVKQKEAKPDYEIVVITKDGEKIALGSKVDTSAKETLVWDLNEPVGLSSISAIRLQEKDTVVSDTIAEVQIAEVAIEENGYQFEFKKESSFAIGMSSFFETSIGKAIAMGFLIAVVILIVGIFGPAMDVL